MSTHCQPGRAVRLVFVDDPQHVPSLWLPLRPQLLAQGKGPTLSVNLEASGSAIIELLEEAERTWCEHARQHGLDIEGSPMGEIREMADNVPDQGDREQLDPDELEERWDLTEFGEALLESRR